jgi:hypothetical protein
MGNAERLDEEVFDGAGWGDAGRGGGGGTRTQKLRAKM